MDSLHKASSQRERAAALIIVLAFVVLVTALAVAYFSRATSDRPVAHASFNQSKADLLVASAMDNIIGDLRQEITNGSTATTTNGTTIYIPNSAANMIPQRSGNAAGVPNLIRLSVRSDSLSGNPAPGSRASAVNSTTRQTLQCLCCTPLLTPQDGPAYGEPAAALPVEGSRDPPPAGAQD